MICNNGNLVYYRIESASCDFPTFRNPNRLLTLAAADVGIISSVPAKFRFRRCSTLPGAACAAPSRRVRCATPGPPHGNGDMLDRCWLLSWRTACRTDPELIGALDMGSASMAMASTSVARVAWCSLRARTLRKSLSTARNDIAQAAPEDAWRGVSGGDGSKGARLHGWAILNWLISTLVILMRHSLPSGHAGC